MTNFPLMETQNLTTVDFLPKTLLFKTQTAWQAKSKYSLMHNNAIHKTINNSNVFASLLKIEAPYFYVHIPSTPHFQQKTACKALHYEPEWEFCLGFWLGGNTTYIHDFCIPLDFLGIKDLKKFLKRPNIFSKATAKATALFIEIL